ncbi:hypothetical protein Ais01nite_68830 [Asanoa ishikariensis]|uniref:Intein C-terminal splicing region/intein N-terminal splicing region n=1 Tax=Asanoa ishikariensis TaxID=137265 RepID=A0A1H3N5D1_9ACTN|nr:TROVE domain-containing protein [Asanoa ishikariensis]GIF68848.1 hypothetical protein Ais01nite_68830 [Asanoa ishikariensis]SDY84076.1 intein C-terminal splicing region/intein N-terminal splicing region [Asanoa ishikariensis]
MSKFNSTATRTATGSSPVTTATVSTGRTYEGAPGFARDQKSELFLLAVTNMVGEATFYESASDRDSRFVRLVREVAVADPPWVAGFLGWLRSDANMRSASLVGALEATRALVDAGVPGGRQLVAAVLKRPDEPGEALAYWTSRYGRAIPKPVKRGVADAIARLYTEYGLLKYDTAGKGFRFADVIDLVHPAPAAPWQGDLFQAALERRHHRDAVRRESLPMLAANSELRQAAAADPRVLLDAERLRAAGMTWEDMLSLAGDRLDKAALWSALVPGMGYMACLAEGTEIWMPDGTTKPIEQVVARRLPVLAPSRPFDTSAVRHGPGRPVRDRTMGDIVPALPSAWLSMGEHPVVRIDFVSGRSVSATLDHRWVKRRRNDRRESWEWVTTADLEVGDGIPAPIGVNAWGDDGDSADGYFVGAMLGDGCMTNFGTPEFAQVDEPSRANMFQFFSDYAGKLGCVFAKCGERKWRITYPLVRKMNPATDVLRRYGVWGLKSGEKRFPNRPLSREFWIGALSGLIDTDGHVRIRTNPKGTLHASIEYATISETMAYQVADALQRLGMQSNVRAHRARPGRFSKAGVRANDIHIVSVNRAASIRRANDVLALRHTVKADRLAEAAALMPATPVENVEQDRIVGISEPFAAQVYCVAVDQSSAFVANGVVTGNCLRNLRNLDQAGVSDEVAGVVAARLADPTQVAASRQLPMRFLSAYRAVPSLRWAYPLEQAIGHSLASVPALPGRTLVLVDTSYSMNAGFSKDGTLRRWDAAVIFGVALAQRCAAADVVSFSTSTKVFPLVAGESLLRSIERWQAGGFFMGNGTDTSGALRRHFARHDRVVVVTDEQAAAGGNVDRAVPASVPMFTWNLAGYRMGHAPSGSGNRHTLGGLTDQAFRMIPLLSAGRDADWPWVRG